MGPVDLDAMVFTRSVRSTTSLVYTFFALGSNICLKVLTQNLSFSVRYKMYDVSDLKVGEILRKDFKKWTKIGLEIP